VQLKFVLPTSERLSAFARAFERAQTAKKMVEIIRGKGQAGAWQMRI
jgi:hypothetical protein